ncbi:Uncharacterised protein [Serratia quinivorans]|uniref:hypothetical protein n=1 Tax=Serratia quinivorans TaxID=137545 RepID=UPI0021782C6B|nr:hypothetical protein [Serratia quinivorans]CAI0994860.1 Uncharacterised protein [Serratia quinivorans]
MSDIKAPEVSLEVFGGVFDIDGAGQYPGIELLNFILCSPDGLKPTEGRILIQRSAHDFSRRLIRDETLPEEEKRNVLLDLHSEQAISKLLRSLELELPNLVKSKSWERTHFFPFTSSLVHWDARTRKGKEQILLERRYFRGAGAYAFVILRADQDLNRLKRIREGFQYLYPNNDESPLEMLAKTLRDAGITDKEPVADEVAYSTSNKLKFDDWEELYRKGVDNILSYHSASVVDRVRSLVTWTGIWSVIMMAGRAETVVACKVSGFILDCASTHSQLRRASQKNYKTQLINIDKATTLKAEELNGELSIQQLGKIKGFFGNTAVSCGIGNAWKGRRHFTLRLESIDALVMAGIACGDEVEFENFMTGWLYHHCRLIIGRNAASSENLLNDLDATIFEENERSLAEQMLTAGMLRMYSDATRMVSYGGDK